LFLEKIKSQKTPKENPKKVPKETPKAVNPTAKEAPRKRKASGIKIFGFG